jgi:hypothetical protein
VIQSFVIFIPFGAGGQDAVSNSRPIANIHVINNAAGQSRGVEEHWHFCLPRDSHRQQKSQFSLTLKNYTLTKNK